MAQSVRSFEEITTLLGIGDDVIQEFIVGVYSNNDGIPDLGALIDTELGKPYLVNKRLSSLNTKTRSILNRIFRSRSAFERSCFQSSSYCIKSSKLNQR